MSLSRALPQLSQDILKLLQEGYQTQMRGELEEAARKYRKILEKAPDTVDAIHLLAMVRSKRGGSRNPSVCIATPTCGARPTPSSGIISRMRAMPYAQALTLDPAMPEAVGRSKDLRARISAARDTPPPYDIHLEDAYEAMVARWLDGAERASLAVPSRN